jgi:hypothetical protein
MSKEKIKFDNFMIHIDTSEHTLTFEVFPIQDWTCDKWLTCKTGYKIKDTGSDTLEVFDTKKVEKLFEGSFCWRGVWEGRLYFTQDEYWGEDLKEMSDLYELHIVPWCKAFIKNRLPDRNYDD